ncbi:MAG: hypothetical protein AB9917_24120 [Negativicutes bacterium]
MRAKDERTQLYNEIWKEPMTTVAKRYGVSDNGLRKRCIKLEIPLPPIGYWAKVKAGVEVPPQPKLPPIKIQPETIVVTETKGTHTHAIEFLNLSEKSTEELQQMEGLEILTAQSQKDFLKWCKNIQVPRKVDPYHPLIAEYQKEMEYRKLRDKEHKFREHFRYGSVTYYAKVEYRENILVLPIDVSEKQQQRAFRIVDTFIKLIAELKGKVAVEQLSYNQKDIKDNVNFLLFQKRFSFQIRELMVKRRSLMMTLPDAKMVKEFKPLYEKVYAGIMEIELKQMSADYWEKNEVLKTFIFKDKKENPLEDQLGEIIKTIFIAIQEDRIKAAIEWREKETRELEQERLREIEEEKQKKLQVLIAREKRQKKLVEDVEDHMGVWYKAQKLRQYADRIEEYAASQEDAEINRALIRYASLVRKKAEESDPIDHIVSEMKEVGIKE